MTPNESSIAADGSGRKYLPIKTGSFIRKPFGFSSARPTLHFRLCLNLSFDLGLYKYPHMGQQFAIRVAGFRPGSVHGERGFMFSDAGEAGTVEGWLGVGPIDGTHLRKYMAFHTYRNDDLVGGPGVHALFSIVADRPQALFFDCVAGQPVQCLHPLSTNETALSSADFLTMANADWDDINQAGYTKVNMGALTSLEWGSPDWAVYFRLHSMERACRLYNVKMKRVS